MAMIKVMHAVNTKDSKMYTYYIYNTAEFYICMGILLYL